MGPCETFGNCTGTGNDFASTEALRSDLWAAAVAGEVDELRSMMAEHPELITLNRSRAAIQLINCTGDGILLSIPLPAPAASALAD